MNASVLSQVSLEKYQGFGKGVGQQKDWNASLFPRYIF